MSDRALARPGRSRPLLTVVTVYFLAFGAEAQERIVLHVDIDERVNAVYHLACLAGAMVCTKSVFDRFWNERMAWTDEDQAALDVWRHAMADVTATAPQRPAAPMLPNTMRFHPGQAAREGLIAAAMESASARELATKSAGVVSLADAERLEAAVAHFVRRLNPWLESAIDANLRARVEEAKGAAERSGFPETMAQMTMFLESELDDPDVYLHVIVPPEPESEDSMAATLRRHLVIEAVNTADAEALVGGAVHELTHYLYDRAPEPAHGALIEEFSRSGSPSAVPLYTYLNEAIAISAQALHAERQGEHDGDAEQDESYNHPYIAPLGEAAAPLVADAVKRGGTLFDGFASRYIEAGTRALRDTLQEPQFVLAQTVLLVPDDGERIAAAFFANLFPYGSAQFRDASDLDNFPSAPVVRFVRYNALDSLSGAIPEIAPLTDARGFAYAIRRTGSASTYVLAGRDTDDVIDVVEELGALTALPAEGLVLRLD
jgi:hypothetical protein